MKKPSLLVIFLTVFLDLIGFGIVLPLLPLYSKDYGANGFMIGFIMASYSIMQFLFAPIWGRWSDRVGRRPVILVSTAGSAISYSLFAFASSLEGQAALVMLIVSRVFAGICGANINVAQAYIADITPPQDRSKRMGLIGMAFGLGFIFGPALGAFSASKFGHSGPGWVASAMCAINFLLAMFILPESWTPSSEHANQRPRFTQWAHTMQTPKVGLLIGLFFLATFCFTCFETTLGLLVEGNYHFTDPKKVGYLFAYCGIIGAVVQGGAIGRMVKKMGDGGLIAFSLIMVTLSLGPLPFVTGKPALLFFLALLSIGSSLTRPPIFGMISNLSPAHEQGATLGVAQSAGSLARIFGPIFAGTLFQIKPSLPYVICSGVSLVAGIIAWQHFGKFHLPVPSAATEGAKS
jgi:DHA1 family tetracycline resistance protein-like MFS transporter